jgi:hypothetical protein
MYSTHEMPLRDTQNLAKGAVTGFGLSPLAAKGFRANAKFRKSFREEALYFSKLKLNA